MCYRQRIPTALAYNSCRLPHAQPDDGVDLGALVHSNLMASTCFDKIDIAVKVHPRICRVNQQPKLHNVKDQYCCFLVADTANPERN